MRYREERVFVLKKHPVWQGSARLQLCMDGIVTLTQAPQLSFSLSYPILSLSQYTQIHNTALRGSLENRSSKQTKREKMNALIIPLTKSTNDLRSHKSIHQHVIVMKTESHFNEQIRYQNIHLRRASLWLHCCHRSWGEWDLQKGKVNRKNEGKW